ncbi:MAG: hypothetical protein JO083_06700 [Candidatus Eremiobacteraeota bacterium]|nr:hypothetical protein [Candidatus Eremiobacteraeota bacterium]
MKTATLARLLSAGAIAVGLSACSNGAAQPPQLPQSGPHKSSVFRDVGTSGSSRSVSTVAIGHCTQVATSKGILYAKLVPTAAVDHANIDASHCDIGIYLGPSSHGQRIDHTSVTDADQYGIFADQAQNVTIDHTTVARIGNHTNGAFAPNGVQTGVGLYFRGATGTVDHTDISLYQKNGTAFNCLFDDVTGACLKPSSVSMMHSTAVGLGQVGFIAQNGIQYLDSTAPQFEHNSATNNSYYNPADTLYNGSATGFLFLCTNVASESQLRAQHNAAENNDFNYYVDNNPADC